MLVLDDEKDPLKKGDQLSVELLSITPFMYSYWYSLSESALGQVRVLHQLTLLILSGQALSGTLVRIWLVHVRLLSDDGLKRKKKKCSIFTKDRQKRFCLQQFECL
ncbi:hypothetical protein LWM68_10750 [Niabella sp. W65]|nr:hypothetical protein [Niabella sp. W65]MCH7363199.1 hypothetical protein [Niabella sp. W65]